MEDNRNSKIITVAFVVAGFLAAITFRVVLESFAASFGIVARFYSQEWVQHLLPIIVGVVTFSVLRFHPQVQAVADEAVTEILKVVWPTKVQTTSMTIVVCIMLFISSVILGVFDFASNNLVKMIIN